MALFEIAEIKEEVEDKSKIKLKKGQTINDLILEARKLVNEKLSNYKDSSKLITKKEDLVNFFNEVAEDSIIALDTETTGLDTFSDKIVGMSFCNGIQSIYVPVNHKSPLYNVRLNNQIPEEECKDIIRDIIHNKHFRYIYHNAKFDLRVFKTWLKENMPAPYWDTMIARVYVIR